MSNVKNLSLAAALCGHEELFIKTLHDCLISATQNLSDEEFSKAFIPEKHIAMLSEKLLLAA